MGKILVTGGAGFVGSHLILALLEDGHDIVCVDNLNNYYDPALKKARLALFEGKIKFYKIDIANRKALEKVFAENKIDTIYHLAAQAGVRYSIENPFIYADSNYIGTLNIFELAKRNNAKQVIFTSTSSVYGLNKPPFREDDRVDTPISIYASSKRACELLAFSYCHLFDLNITCIRLFTVYGPYGRPDLSLFKFTKAILADEPIDVYNNGDMMRDFTYISDTVAGLVSALNKPTGFEIINLARGKSVQLMNFIQEIERALGKKTKKNFLPMQPGDVKETSADISKAQKLLKYRPRVDIQDGIQSFVEWYKMYHKIS